MAALKGGDGKSILASFTVRRLIGIGSTEEID